MIRTLARTVHKRLATRNLLKSSSCPRGASYQVKGLGFVNPYVNYKSQLHISCIRNIITGSMDGAKGFKIEGPHFESLFTEPFKELIAVFDRHGFEIRIAGGAVRDLLSGQTPHDIDLATTATPAEMRQMFNAENIRMFNEQGEKHGTVSVRILDLENFEITTLRIDKVTDGRHAEVEFTTDWRIDAERRDLTVNSMFLGLDGTLFDFFDGQTDLKNKRIAFVGNPVARIQEDYLRILRYFRFFGRLANDDSQHEEETLLTIANNVQGMAKISGERIWSEWKKILSGKQGGPLTIKMIEVGLAPYIGLPKDPDVKQMETVWKDIQERRVSLNSMTLLTTLLQDEKEMMALHGRLKFSGVDRDLGLFVVNHRGNLTSFKQCKDILADTKAKIVDCRNWIEQVLLLDNRADILEDFLKWELPKFPVGGQDLKEVGCPPGKMFSAVLQKLKEAWKMSDFELTREDLLTMLPNVIDEINLSKPHLSPKRQKLDSGKKST